VIKWSRVQVGSEGSGSCAPGGGWVSEEIWPPACMYAEREGGTHFFTRSDADGP
jgi:hypothetical protein